MNSIELNLGPLLVVGREVQFETGRADLICVDEGGQVVVVEFKKGTENPDSRRVVAQMLDYGSHLWGWSFDDFEAKIALPFFRNYWNNSPRPTSLREAASSRFDFSASGEGVEKFAQGVADILTSGAFVYLIVARTSPPTLERVLGYLDAVSLVKTAAIAVDYFQDQDRQILVPRVVTATTATASAARSPRGGKTNPQEFLQEVGPAEPFWSNLLQFLGGLPGEFYWGQKGFSFRVVLRFGLCCRASSMRSSGDIHGPYGGSRTATRATDFRCSSNLRKTDLPN